MNSLKSSKKVRKFLMEINNLKYLVISRYITYMAVFIMALAVNRWPIIEVVCFSVLFLIILINSSVRIRSLVNKEKLYTVSILLEIPFVVIMYRMYSSFAGAFFYIVIVDIYLFYELKKALYMNLAVYVGIIIALLPSQGSVDIVDLGVSFLGNAVLMSFFAASSYSIIREQKMKITVQRLYEELKESKEELQDTNRKLQNYAEKIEEMAVLHERNRIAGEIHDSIGHRLTGLIMEIDICGKLIDKDTAKTKEELAKASQLARDTLSEVRKSVREIIPSNMEELTGINAIKELIREFEKNSKIRVELNLSEYRYRLTPTIEVTLYRTIQEALTNCAKYGRADRVHINLDFKESNLWLNIKDNGKGCNDFAKGVGLSTMEERIHSLGGSIEFNCEDCFSINVVIPVEV